jgi:hypothetical protein
MYQVITTMFYKEFIVPTLLTVKKMAKYSAMTAAMIVVSQGAFAHTRFETPTIVETAGGYSYVHNRLNIGHGCMLPSGVVGQPTFGTNVIFPNAAKYTPVIGVDSTGANTNVSKVYTTQPASDFYSPAASLGKLIRVGGPFPSASIKADALNNHDGFWTGGKNYDQTVSTQIQVDFAVGAITINPKSCARSVTFYAAIADFCNSASVPSNVATDQDILFWSPIPNFTGVPGQPFGAPTADLTSTNLSGGVPAAHAYSNYDGYEDAAHTKHGDGWGSPASLTVKRNLVTNPLPSGCTGNAGTGDDIYVYPSAEQINAEMPIWSGIHQGEGTNYWK